ncbi:MAG: hypothetical protein ABI333_14500 [bacterium]
MSSHCFQGLWRAWAPAALVVLITGTACAPELGNDRPPDVMEFDPTAEPPRSPEPNVVVTNPETGLIDFSVLGTPLPAYADECVNWDALPVAQCAF